MNEFENISNPEIFDYAEKHTRFDDVVLHALIRETHLKTINPRMLSGAVQGKLLEMISRMMQPQRILEIGTFTGFATICLAKGLAENGQLITLEKNPEYQYISNRFFAEANLQSKITQHIGLALEIIPTLNEIFDLVFIDADKPNLLNYYQQILPKMRPGGMILVDNVLWSGKVIDEKANDKDTLIIREFNDFVQNDPRVENLLLPVRDGLMMIRIV